ncbi:MAG TPA: hypothetical protein VM557_09985, partial [Thermoanaerobaculia bacterium]|nr:hypothetical protein [Thermoanaerobaculia bacterium]
RDEQFVLRPAANNLAEVIAAGEAGPIYQIGANVHYGLSITRPPWNHLSLLFGLSADVPVDSLSAYLGLALTAWTFPEDNAVHIFVGLGYTKADRLAPEFLGLTSVPDATPASALIRSEYDFGITAGISFSFFGGQDQFKAAFPGKASGEAAP